MNLRIKILGAERTDNGMNRVILQINGKDVTSVLLTDTEVQSPQAAKNAIKSLLKVRAHIGQEFDIVI